jgi:glycine/D-amino acid oxidase-like deaminating enzyme
VNPYWLEDLPPLAPTPLHGRVDVAIVGGGVTGCAAALRLAEAGLRVRVHDQRGIAEGASGRNGGFALAGGAAAYDVARDTYGPEEARALWQWTADELRQLAELAGDALREVGCYRLASDDEEREQVRREFEALRDDGFPVEWLDDLPGPLSGVFAGVTVQAAGGSLQPARFVRRLAQLAAEAGAELREHDRVEDVDALDADQVVIATDGYGHGLVPELDGILWPTRGQIVVSEPLDRVVFDRPHYARHGFDYWQQLPDGRVLLGGFRDTSILDELTDEETTTEAIQSALERFLAELIGADAGVTHRWAGIFALTQDMLPLVGPVPGRERVWVAAGYSGHGNVLGFSCGRLVADAILGRPAPQCELLDPARFAAY